MEVEREEPASVGLRPGIAFVDQAAAVGMATAEAVGRSVAGGLPAGTDIEVEVIGMLIDQLIGQRVGIDTVGLGEVGSGNQMPEMAVDGVHEETLPLGGPVVAPGVGRAGGQHLGSLLADVIPPEAALHGQPLLIGGARAADPRGAGVAAAAVEPAVGAEGEAVGQVVMARRANLEAIEHHLSRSIGHEIAVGIRDEEDLRRAAEPHASVAHRHAREQLHVVGEHDRRIEKAIAVRIVKDEHTVAQRAVKPQPSFGVGEVFSDPQAAAGILADGDRVAERRFGGKQLHPKALRHRQGSSSLHCGEGRCISLLAVGGLGKGVVRSSRLCENDCQHRCILHCSIARSLRWRPRTAAAVAAAMP